MGVPQKWSTDPQGVVFLSQQRGLRVAAAGGSPVGRLHDLTVRVGEPHPLVHRLVVRAGRHSTSLLPWGDVAAVTPAHVLIHPGVDLRSKEVDPSSLPLEDDELLLARDVMDTQVVDLEGHRLSRVSDVFLLQRDDGRLEVVAVDVGIASVLRRTRMGWLARRVAPVAVDWEDLHLTSSRGHAVQLSISTAGFRRLDARGLAELLARLSTQKATDVMRTVGPERAAAAVHDSHPLTGRRLMHALGHEDAQRLLEAAPPEQTERLAELRRHLPAVRRRRFLRTAGWRVRRPGRSEQAPSRAHKG